MSVLKKNKNRWASSLSRMHSARSCVAWAWIFTLSFQTLPVLTKAAVFSANGFESPTYSTGDLTGQDAWVAFASGDPLDEASIQTSVVYAGSQAGASIRGSANTGTTFESRRTFTAATGPLRFFTQFRIEGMDTGGGNFHALYLHEGTTHTADRVTILYFRGNGNITVFDGGAETTVGTWLEDTWFSIELLMNPIEQTFDLSIAGSKLADDFDFLDNISAVGGFTFQEFGGLQNGGFYFDDTKVSLVPEPTTGVLFLLGVLLTRHFRRGVHLETQETTS